MDRISELSIYTSKLGYYDINLRYLGFICSSLITIIPLEVSLAIYFDLNFSLASL